MIRICTECAFAVDLKRAKVFPDKKVCDRCRGGISQWAPKGMFIPDDEREML